MYYTKYRPQKFSEILKPNQAASALANQVKDSKTAHAYLFIGSRGTGKTTTARILAKALNCTKPLKSGDPCGKCANCVSIQENSFTDLIEIDAASNRGIDDIRSLRDKIKLSPAMGSHKVYIIDEVHMLTTEAFNALLKTLEEPPAHATFILCTTESHKVPETIKSRCQVFNFKRASVDQLVEKLLKICEAENIKVNKTGKGNPETLTIEDLKQIAIASHGGFRDAETMLEQVVEGGLDVNSFVSRQAENSYVEFVGYILVCDSQAALGLINRLFDDGLDLHAWSVGLVSYLRDLLFISADAHEGLVDVSEKVFSDMEEQAGKFTTHRLVEVVEAFVEASSQVKASSIPQLPLELAVVKLCNGSTVSNTSGVGEPIQNLEGDTDSATGTGEVSLQEAVDIVDMELGPIVEKWDQVIQESKPYNHSVHALLKSTKPVKIDEGTLVLEVYYAFHKERIESTKNRQIVESAMETVYGSPIRIKCVLSKEKPQSLKKNESGKLTDYNVQVPASNKPMDENSLLDVFDGGLPL